MTILAFLRSIMPCPRPGCRGSMAREAETLSCATCGCVARPRTGSWRYPGEATFRWRLPGAVGRRYVGEEVA